MTAMISLNGVSYRYKDASRPALSDVTLTIARGDWLTVVGRNGSGKSTFGRLLNGLFLPTEGEVIVDGLLTSDEHQRWSIRQKVGIVFQNPDHQFVATTVRDDIAFGLENLGLDRAEMRTRIERYAQLIGLTSLLDEEIDHLSGGQKQRVAIAGVFAMEPDVIVFDEATSMLDPIGRKEVLQTMKRLHEIGCTIVSITHHMDEAFYGNRVVVFHDGKIIADRSPRDVFFDDALLFKAGLEEPFVVQMQKMLERRGISFTKRCVTEEELISELWRSFLAE